MYRTQAQRIWSAKARAKVLYFFNNFSFKTEEKSLVGAAAAAGLDSGEVLEVGRDRCFEIRKGPLLRARTRGAPKHRGVAPPHCCVN